MAEAVRLCRWVPVFNTVSAGCAGSFSLVVKARTVCIGGPAFAQIYRREYLRIDPDAELEDGCLVVAQFKDGEPFMDRWWRTGRDIGGRFIRPGDPREAFMLRCGVHLPMHEDRTSLFRILGRVFDEPQRTIAREEGGR